MIHYKDDETDRELKEKVNKMTLHQKDVENHTLRKHKDMDLKYFPVDEGY